MKKVNKLISFIIGVPLLISSVCYAQEDIEKMNKNVSFFSLNNKKLYIKIGLGEPIESDSSYKSIYYFTLTQGSLEVKLQRKWKILPLFWNTHIMSDTIEFCPIDTVKLHCAGSTMYYYGCQSAYCGPKKNKKQPSDMKSIWHLGE